LILDNYERLLTQYSIRHHHDHDEEEDYEGQGDEDDGVLHIPPHGPFSGNVGHIGDLIDALGPHAGGDPMEILQRIDANMDADEEAEMAAAELEAELEAEREAEEAEDDEGDMPHYMEDEGKI